MAINRARRTTLFSVNLSNNNIEASWVIWIYKEKSDWKCIQRAVRIISWPSLDAKDIWMLLKCIGGEENINKVVDDSIIN